MKHQVEIEFSYSEETHEGTKEPRIRVKGEIRNRDRVEKMSFAVTPEVFHKAERWAEREMRECFARLILELIPAPPADLQGKVTAAHETWTKICEKLQEKVRAAQGL